MTDTPKEVPAPGTTTAAAMGCTCAPRDGELDPGHPDWPDWLTLGCPIHGNVLVPVDAE